MLAVENYLLGSNSRDIIKAKSNPSSVQSSNNYVEFEPIPNIGINFYEPFEYSPEPYGIQFTNDAKFCCAL